MINCLVVLKLLGQLAGCTNENAVDVEASCSGGWSAQPLVSPHRCVGSGRASGMVDCCIESEGLGIDFESIAVHVSPALLLESNVDPAAVISESAALCIADTQGLNPTREASSAMLRLSSGSLQWTVMSWGPSSCDGKQAGEMGGAEGCGLMIDALTGTPEFASSVSATLSCQ